MDESAQPDDEIGLVIQPGSDRFDAEDDRWISQVSELFRGLDDEVGGVRRESVQVPGTKGTVDTVILALGSAGAFTTGVQYLRTWLGRDRSRRLDLTWEIDGRTERVTLSGDVIDTGPLNRLAEAFATRIEGKSWPNPPTEPS